jgi:uncharacterized protein (DUF2235 family)
MPKNIVICCDGTSNAFDGDRTNVSRLYQCAARATGAQVTYYDPGVGTMPEVGLRSWIGKKLSVVGGLMNGNGILRNIEEAYTYLMEVFEPDDRVFLFGFSRGAYTVRALAGMIHAIGLLRYGTTNLIPYAMKYWRKAYGKKGGGLAREFKTTMSRECKPHFLGVWDTVSSVGWFNFFQSFPYTQHNPDIGIARHAVSIDERRCCFRQNLVAPEPVNQDVQNVWFAGVHADIGGGYPEPESGLAKITLKWIADEARNAGLLLDEDLLNKHLGQTTDEYTKADPCAQLHNSLAGLWWLLEFLPRRQWSPTQHCMTFAWRPARRRALGTAAILHPSVKERMEKVGYNPNDLPPRTTTAGSELTD